MSNYTRGARFEHKVMDDLGGRGWKCVRSAGSHSPVDVVACMRGRETVFVQCKKNGRLDPDEWNGFAAFCAAAGAVPVLASDRRGGVDYHLITGVKTGSRKKSPMRDYNDEMGA